MSCARCGCGIYKTEEFISLNKVWHRYCFTCYQCSKRLNKDCAKIFQGELFCESCYANVIEKLFEVISTPALNKPCRVASTPSCAATNNNSTCESPRNCLTQVKSCGPCGKKQYCFPVEKKLNECIQRSVQSCSCIPNQNEAKDEYCFLFPMPREVANYYNRAHMRNKACKDPISCAAPYQGHQGAATCSCKDPSIPVSKCQVQVRTLKNHCASNNSTSRCRNPSPQRCCCCSSSSPTPSVFNKGCGYCPPFICSDRCSSPTRCGTCNSPPPCQRYSCCPNKQSPYSKTTGPPQTPSYPSTPSKCPPPPQCYGLPPPPPPPRRCSPPPRRCSPSPCCPQKMEGCYCSRCDSLLSENSKSCCRRPRSQKSPKYCICGNSSPCNCKMSQIKAQCTVCCIRCEQKVYAAEKILVSSGAYHTSCFTCFCCKKCLDVKNVFEGCGEIYCKQCYNHFFGIEYYGFGGKNC